MHKWLPWLVGLLSFAYLAPMAAQDYSWVFVSSDSGDWLAAAAKWMVPQTYGAPLYITLSHLIGPYPAALSILLSSLPNSITAVLVFLAIRYLTHNQSIALTGAALTLGSAILLTQSTTLGYHALTVTFLTLAFYYYITSHRYLTTLALALGTAVHMIVLPIALLWLVADRRLRLWMKPILLYIAVTAVSYSFILLLMYLPTPRFLAGGLSIDSVRAYWHSTAGAIIGQISIFEAPKRLLFTIELLLMSFGLALIPLYKSLKPPMTKPAAAVCLVTALFSLWYFVTCQDSMTWTYLAFATPSIIVLSCIGLSQLSLRHTQIILAYSLVILLLNPLFMNANLLTKQQPEARSYANQLLELPQRSIIVVDAGALSLGAFYIINTSRPDITPIVYPYLEYPNFFIPDYANYLQSLEPKLSPTTTLDTIQSALDQHLPTYYAYYAKQHSPLENSFNFEGNSIVRKITGLTGAPLVPKVRDIK